MDLKALKGKSFLRKFLPWLAATLVSISVAGFLVAPPILKSVLLRQLSEKLHREVSIREVQFNPFTLAIKVSGFSMKERGGGGAFVSFEDLYLNFEAASVFRGGPVLRDIILTSPSVSVVRNEDLSYNFSDILEEFASKPSPGSKPLRYSLNNIQIVNGSVDFEDRPKRKRHTVRDLRVAIPFFSNFPHSVDIYVLPVFLAKINGTPVDLRGKTKPFSDSRETSFDVNIKNFNIPYYLEYVPMKLRFKVASAFLDTDAVLSFREYKDKPAVLSLTGTLALKDLKIADGKGKAVLGLPRLELSVASSDIFGRKASLASVLLQSPDLRLARDREGALNFASLLAAPGGGEGKGEAKDKAKATAKEPGAAFLIDAAEVRLEGGRVAFADEFPERPFATVLDAIDVTVRHFSNEPGKSSAVEASLRTESGETLKHDGSFTVDPPGAEGAVDAGRLKPKKYAPYYGKAVLFDVEDGVLDLSFRYRYAGGERDDEITLSGLSASLNSLRLKKRGETEDFLKVPVAAVKGTDIDLGKRTLKIGEFSTRGGEVRVNRGGDGSVNLGTLLPSTAPPGPGKAGPPPKEKGGSPPEWLVTLAKVAMDRYSVKVEDRTTSPPVVLSAEPLGFSAANLSTGKGVKGKASLRVTWNGKGTLVSAGTVGLNPISANLDVDAKGIGIIPFQPYFTEKIKIVVTGGSVSAKGTLALGTASDNALTAAYKGEASLTEFATVDKATSEDFLKWKTLHLGGIDAQIHPLRVEIDEIALADFYSRLAVNPDGTLNVQQVFAGGPKTPAPGAAAGTDNAAAPGAPEPAKFVRIETVTVQGGTVRFSDRNIKPNYVARLTGMGGRISGLSSEESKFADVDLRGKLENHAPLEITGKINPLRNDLYVDLKADFKDIDLSPLTPYSGKYAGYAIEKGKLTLALKYLITKRTLDASNHVFLDQFTFGNPVESPDATKLPVRLAVALLKDRSGEINLDIPLSGSLDDPKFSVGRIVLKIIVNILVKAATSPFALLGAIFGGGEELGALEFDYGKSEWNAAMEARLKTLEKVLNDRPGLKLEIAGRVDTAKDRDGLLRSAFERKVRAQKLLDLAGGGAPPASLDNVVIAPAEYPKYLERAYKKEKFPKPRNFIGMAKTLPVAEMEKLMLTHIKITDDDLRQLAMRRAQGVRDALLKSGRVAPERIFLVEPKALSPEKKEKLKDSRVDFVLK